MHILYLHCWVEHRNIDVTFCLLSCNLSHVKYPDLNLEFDASWIMIIKIKSYILYNTNNNFKSYCKFRSKITSKMYFLRNILQKTHVVHNINYRFSVKFPLKKTFGIQPVYLTWEKSQTTNINMDLKEDYLLLKNIYFWVTYQFF